LAVGELLPLIHHQPECLNLSLVQAQGAQVGNALLRDQVQDVIPRPLECDLEGLAHFLKDRLRQTMLAHPTTHPQDAGVPTLNVADVEQKFGDEFVPQSLLST